VSALSTMDLIEKSKVFGQRWAKRRDTVPSLPSFLSLCKQLHCKRFAEQGTKKDTEY